MGPTGQVALLGRLARARRFAPGLAHAEHGVGQSKRAEIARYSSTRSSRWMSSSRPCQPRISAISLEWWPMMRPASSAA